MVCFRDLSWDLKVLVVFGWVSLFLSVVGFLVGYVSAVLGWL